MQGGDCPRCGAPARALQEYCLECGARLFDRPGVRTTLASVWRPRPAWYPGEWLAPVLVLLVVAILVAAPLVLWSGTSGEPDATLLVATRAATGPLLSVEAEAVPTPTEPALPPRATVPQPAQPPPRPRTEPIEWPPNLRSGWTVVLASLPTSDGRSAADEKATEAIQAGLRDVGVLDSGEFASLHPGYFVVFVGAYDTPAEAQDAAERARARGYDAAYIRQITI